MTPSTPEVSNRWDHHTSSFGRMKILVIDDEPANTALLVEMLAEGGYTRVKSINDSRLAGAVCEEFEPDLVLLDLMMPHVDGFAILQAIRSAPPSIFLPVVVLTADVTDATRRRALQAGATDYLLKPLDHIEVFFRISNLLEMRQLHLQLDTQRAALEDALRARTLELREATARLEAIPG